MPKEKATEKNVPSRRAALRKIVQSSGFIGLGGLLWGGLLDEKKEKELILRPPGAIDEPDFLAACIKCGACVEACPYDTLQIARSGDSQPVGTPYFAPRETPCYMCPDIPCVPVCPTGALDALKVSTVPAPDTDEVAVLDINKATMGLAMVDKNSCIAYWGVQCDACYRACPLINEAITLDYERNDRTGKHAFMRPVINADVCTGCGMCEHACVTEKAAIMVFPREAIMGRPGDFYVKGWDKEDQERVKNADEPVEQVQEQSTLDYLNGWNDLLEEE